MTWVNLQLKEEVASYYSSPDNFRRKEINETNSKLDPRPLQEFQNSKYRVTSEFFSKTVLISILDHR